MDNKITPNYYANIPANVRYDKDLSANAKLLYGEITALTNVEGYCWATNAYFADLYEMSTRNISRLISQLAQKGYIRVEIINDYERKIYIALPLDKNVVPPRQECLRGYDKNVQPPHDKNVYKNNTSINTTSNINKNTKKAKKNSSSSELESEFELLWKKYPRKIGKAKAFQSYSKARKVKKYTFETIEIGLNKYLEYLEMNGTDEQYIQHGSTWFNQENFLSEYETTNFQKKPQLSRFNQMMVNQMENPDDFLNLIGVNEVDERRNRKILNVGEVHLS